ncbi:putative Ig domain-containing protein [Geomonas paludis]|uniref:Ig domain-containing protein n=1 Tax=Geomonas paludis TaxID=2740185 RepID=A0ABY4LJ23_9BACT|nr:putative Ig domain-containing protein [Geomonas paludis]UPU37857.1 putative Ig domain-containing protein [Geomonas paludis]
MRQKVTRGVLIACTVAVTLVAAIVSFAGPPAPPAAPTISGAPSSTATVGVPYSFAPTATDAASFSISGTVPPGLTFSTSTGALTGTPTLSGTYGGITITANNVSDSASLPAFSIAVGANHSPTISGTPATSIASGSAYSFFPSASDVDGNALSYSISNKPAWASFDTSTGALSGTPTAGTYGDIQIAVSDGYGGTATLPVFTIVVSAPAGGAGGTTAVPVLDGWWLLPGILAGLGIMGRRKKE